ncbi:MAG: glycosyltransferase family 2 protein [Anaerolineae bacterium]
MNETTDQRLLVSVIIPTRDRPDDLARCLPTVLASDYPYFEVIVVDQSSSEASKRVVEALADPRLRYYRQQANGKSRALNAALARARGAIIAFTDDDCTVPPDWLRRGLDVLAQEPEAGIVFGAAAAAPHNPRETFVPVFLPPHYRRLQGRFARVRCHGLAGPNMFIRPTVFERVGGFDDFLGAGSHFPSGDDDDLAYRALRAGFAVVLDPTNAIVHWAMRSYTDGSGQRLLRNHYYGSGAFYVKHLRCGDPLAAYALLRLAWKETVFLATNLIRQRRASGAGRLLYLLLGLIRGFRHPLDHKRRLYVPARA